MPNANSWGQPWPPGKQHVAPETTLLSRAIGAKVMEVRERKGITQRELGQRAGMSQPTVCRWETGKRTVTLELLYRIANALEVDAKELLP